ncbi:prepilin-type N-terminal cleavage/methylation domain-containing protein [Terrimicrobium sacchariphilum]|uniref:Prepilin-type N-terminal cleavage/methylation domain-containing protein n=2 Tax=Terrimicrobium sacchariphilum TaxID=690879 RepID=A0A146G300_TERSA|nr:prepilin-type N-terminal cleavage/methylation domain-containing protein [Terrimicrobium sacchariphilum]
MKNMEPRIFFKSSRNVAADTGLSKVSLRAGVGAFSLMEMMITVAIIGTLAALCMPAWTKIKDNSMRARDVSNLRGQAMAVLAYAGEHDGVLPGRINRGVAIPSTVTTDSKRTYYLSTVLIDAGYCSKDDKIWKTVCGYGADQFGVAYVVNSGKSSVPTYFFGNRSSTAGATTYDPKRIVSLKSNLDPDKDPKGKDEEPLSQIWMITNADGENYNSSTTGGLSNSLSEDVRTPWGGRHYVYFDAHVEFKRSGEYPSVN